MNRFENKIQVTACRRGALVRLLLGLIVGLGFACGVDAQTPLYINLQDSQYYSPPTVLSPPNSPPQIDATAFDNEGSFELYFYEDSPKATLYEPSDTMFYTNNGLMTANAPLPTNGLSDNVLESVNLLEYASYGAGFVFGYLNPTNSGLTLSNMSSVFYNAGTIRCNSVLDGNNTVLEDNLLTSIGTCYVTASNIYNPGNIQLGSDSLLQFTGNHVDLSRSVLSIEPYLPTANNSELNLIETYPSLIGFFFTYGGGGLTDVNTSSFGAFGTDTNADWDLQTDLTATRATSSLPYYFQITNSQAYIKTETQIIDGVSTNTISRCVFIENDSPSSNVSYIVVFTNINDIINGNVGAAYIQWSGTFQDPVTGQIKTNYLLLNNDYVLGASTNVFVTPGPDNNGYPDNFQLYNESSPLFSSSNAWTAGFTNIFPYGSVTNPYDYMDASIIATTVATNISDLNPYGTVTNQYGRIQITASQELNLANAIISGANYVSIQATNQFDGSQGANISAPYSDINLGVTNGPTTPLSVTNLLVSDILAWSGNIQAWSTRYTNTISPGVSEDYRVLIVHSQLSPTTQPWVRTLNLRTGTNGLVVSDQLNVYASFFTDARWIMVTTNGYGFGATSSEGVLSMLYNGNLGPLQYPNLLDVTNNGVIGSQDLITFTNQIAYVAGVSNVVSGKTTNHVNQMATNYFGNVINTGFMNSQGTTIWATNFFDSGTISNGMGGLKVLSQNTTLSNGTLCAGQQISIVATNFVATNTFIQCLSLTLNPTYSNTDLSISNNSGNIWVVGATNSTGGVGVALLNNPGRGDLRGTTITNICPGQNKLLANTWSGRDLGVSNAGFTNNSALGHLILNDAGANSVITFNGSVAGTSNALYVDCLEFQGYLTNALYNNYNFTNWLSLNTNITIYYAQALINGISIAEALDQASLYSGENGGLVSNNVVVRPGRLRWVPTYAGVFSSTNFVVNGVTNYYNAALAESDDIDSNGDVNGYGELIPNSLQSDPFLLPAVSSSELNFQLATTKSPSSAILTWDIIPGLSSNVLYYAPSLTSTNWLPFYSLVTTNEGAAYPVSATDTNSVSGTRFYKLMVQQSLLY